MNRTSISNCSHPPTQPACNGPEVESTTLAFLRCLLVLHRLACTFVGHLSTAPVMSAVLAPSAVDLTSTLHRVLPGSVDLYAARSVTVDAAGGSISAAWLLDSRLQQQRRQRSHTAMVDRDIVAQPPSVDVNVWLYEQLRVMLCELNTLLAALSPHCTAASCPVMRATADWEFLCAAHGSKPLKVRRAQRSTTATHTPPPPADCVELLCNVSVVRWLTCVIR